MENDPFKAEIIPEAPARAGMTAATAPKYDTGLLEIFG